MSAELLVAPDLAGDGLTAQEIELRDRMRKNFRVFCRHLKIKPKGDVMGEGDERKRMALIPFEWNLAQQLTVREMYAMIKMGVPIDLVILKARQFGISTLFCAWIFWLMWRDMQTRTAIVAQKQVTLTTLNETLNTFYESFPVGFRPMLRHGKMKGRVAKDQMYFDDRKAQCDFVIAAKDALRGPNFDAVLTTEVSSYFGPEDFYGGFVPAMNTALFTTLIKESSPADGWFRYEYNEAKANGKTKRAMFFPWWMAAWLYTRPLRKNKSNNRLFDAQTGAPVRFSRAERIEQDTVSRWAREQFGLDGVSDEQLYWRQRMIEDKFGGDEEWFNQEYPRDDKSCFEKSTSSAFKSVLPIVRKTSEEVFDLYPDSGVGILLPPRLVAGETDPEVRFEEDAAGRHYNIADRYPGLFLITPPKPGYEYTIGADVADDSPADEEGDDESAYSTACVYCCDTREQAAEWRGRIDPHDFGDELAKLGYLYNTALICAERNHMGITTEDRLTRYLWYPNMYRWPDWGHGGDKLTNKIGWETNSKTKQIMMAELRNFIREGLFIVRSPGLEQEMAEYIIKNGHYECGTPGVYADRIIAAALAVMAVAQTPHGMSRIIGSRGTESARTGARGAARVVLARKGGAVMPPPRRLPDEFGEMLVGVVDGSYWEAAKL